MPDKKVSAMDRGALYELIASLYLQLPTVENVGQVLEAFTNAEEVFEDIDFSKLIYEARERKEKLAEDTEYIEELKQEYYDHFVVPITSSFIPPYESFIKGATKLPPGKGRKNKGGWQYNTSQNLIDYNVRLAYNSVGFNPENLNITAELPYGNKRDHLGLELAFMAYLCHMEHEAFLEEQTEEGHERKSLKWHKLQGQFLREHLLEFVETYTEIAMEKASPFYKALAEVLRDYVNWDLKDR